jgi:hypothetical protein
LTPLLMMMRSRVQVKETKDRQVRVYTLTEDVAVYTTHITPHKPQRAKLKSDHRGRFFIASFRRRSLEVCTRKVYVNTLKHHNVKYVSKRRIKLG